jgi:hypothetical protein
VKFHAAPLASLAVLLMFSRSPFSRPA